MCQVVRSLRTAIGWAWPRRTQAPGRAIPLPLIGCCALALLGCARQESDLVIASPHRDEIRREFAAGFSEVYRRRTGEPVHLVWLDLGGTAAIQRYLQSRFAAGFPDAGIDIMFGGGADSFEDLKSRGLLEPYRVPPAILRRMPGPAWRGIPIYDPDFSWYGAALSSFGILYNRRVIAAMHQEVPATWSDLGKPEFRTWVGAGDPRLSATVHVVYEIMLQAHGWRRGFRLLTRLAGNTRRFVRTSDEVTRDVVTGDVACAGAIDFYANSLIAYEGPEALGYTQPAAATVISVDPIAIIKNAPHRDLARAFLRFVLSEEGQKLWMLKAGEPGGPRSFNLGRLSVLPELYRLPAGRLTVQTDPFKVEHAMPYNGHLAARRWHPLNDLIGAVFIDAHVELAAAWAAVVRAGAPADLVEQLGEPPCAERDLERLGPVMRQNPRVRDTTMARWTEEAIRKYRRVAAQARRRTAR